MSLTHDIMDENVLRHLQKKLRFLISPFVSSDIFIRQHTRFTASYSSFCIFKYFLTATYTIYASYSSFCIFKYFHTTAYTIYGFLIFLWYLQIFSYDIIYDLRLLIPPLVSSDIFIRHHTRFTASYFSFGIFKLFLHKHIS
jgi:hypothetical protein